jgi:hypothetical protein
MSEDSRKTVAEMSQSESAFIAVFSFRGLSLGGGDDAERIPHLILDEAEVGLLIADRHVPQHRFGLVSRMINGFGAMGHSVDHMAFVAAHCKKFKDVNHDSPRCLQRNPSADKSNARGEERLPFSN